jgi:hypothetical protein
MATQEFVHGAAPVTCSGCRIQIDGDGENLFVSMFRFRFTSCFVCCFLFLIMIVIMIYGEEGDS